MEHNEELDRRQEEEKKARAAVRQNGLAEFERLQEEHRAKIQKNKALNREHESSFIQNRDASFQKESEWERVNAFITTTKKDDHHGADTSRMREVLISMKHS